MRRPETIDHGSGAKNAYISAVVAVFGVRGCRYVGRCCGGPEHAGRSPRDGRWLQHGCSSSSSECVCETFFLLVSEALEKSILGSKRTCERRIYAPEGRLRRTKFRRASWGEEERQGRRKAPHVAETLAPHRLTRTVGALKKTGSPLFVASFEQARRAVARASG